MNVAVDVACGALVGLTLGLTGGGGSIVTVPILVYALGENVHTAIGTSLAFVAAVATLGFVAQRERLDWRTGLVLGAVGTLGNVPGSLLAARVSARTLLLAFAAVMIVAALAMLRPGDSSDCATRRRAWAALVAAGIGLGFLTGLLGVGGGFLIVPTLILALGYTMREAIPTSLLVIAINSLVALATRASGATIAWPTVGLLLVGGVAGNLVGAALARRLDRRLLRTIFAVFVLGVGGFIGGSALGIVPIAFR